MIEFREVLHYHDKTSDKVYIVEVHKISMSEFMVNTLWGKREAKKLSSMVQHTASTRSRAQTEATKLVEAKMRKGYKRIASKLAVAGLPALKDAEQTNKILKSGATVSTAMYVPDAEIKLTRNVKL
jgi:predicted DNA-binding WGR domain protein